MYFPQPLENGAAAKIILRRVNWTLYLLQRRYFDQRDVCFGVEMEVEEGNAVGGVSEDLYI